MENKEIEINIADTIIEMPTAFNIGRHNFCIYPPTLGKTYLLSRLFKNLEADNRMISSNPYAEALRLCSEKKEIVCRILSYYTFKKKDDVFNNTRIEKRVKVFSELTTEELATLFTLVLSGDNTESYINYFGIDKERKERSRIAEIKKDSSSITFGGNSAYGTLIDFACQRYGWTVDYIMWGISYANLKMLIADSVTTIYLSEEERKQLGMSVGEVINGDDPKNKGLIRQMISE